MATLKSAPFLISTGLHVALGSVAWLILDSSPQVRGEAGLRGSPNASLAIEIERPSLAAPAPQRVKSTAREGLEVADPKLPRELPQDLKAKPRIIEDVTPVRPAQAQTPRPGDFQGTPGQGGSGDRVAKEIGNSDRSDALGLYLAKVQSRVQRALRAPGAFERTRRAELQILILQNGRVDRIDVRKSSGDQRLDLLAIDAVKRAQPFDPVAEELTVNIPVLFRAQN